MRFVIALLTLVFAACSTTPVSQSQSQAASPGQGLASEEPKPSTDSLMEFLLRSAATDFHAHRPPVVERFRDVRFGHVMTPAGAKQYQLCGEFLPQQREGKAEWTPFANAQAPQGIWNSKTGTIAACSSTYVPTQVADIKVVNRESMIPVC